MGAELIYACLIVAILAIQILLVVFSGLLQGFLLHINLINGVFLGGIAGSTVYSNHRIVDIFSDKEVHIVICFIVGIIVMFAVILIQKTKVGFWIFAIIMSLVWAAIPAILTYAFTKSWVWFAVVQVLATIMNIFSHLRSRDMKLTLTTGGNQNN